MRLYSSELVIVYSNSFLFFLYYNLRFSNLKELVNKIIIIGAVLNPNGVSKELIENLKSLANKPSENANLRLIELMLNEPNITKSELNKIQNPVLVIAGEKDEVKEIHTKEIQQNISKAELLIIPNSTHYVPFEQPKILNEAILKFLKK
ncbi:3-oxoadipate enol-lactonase [Empedobacter falsenii]|uniref:3-oxoadipate enol-lactonase n=1 Tax=Empedobacter falsenii TaxID=343874 RepID=A0A376G2W4_9FLAO|nr:3-oxoadipate enol-lactonase [Empedobacter falsenii]